jgi:hypothetical protein
MFIQQPFSLLSGTPVTPVTLSVTDDAHSRGGTNYTFSNMDLGAYGIKKTVITAQPFNGTTSKSITGVTVKGVDATELVYQGSTNYEYASSIYFIDSITTTTADIIVSMDINISGVMIGVFAIRGADATAYQTQTTSSGGASNGNPATLNLDIPAGGCAIACTANSGSPMGTSSVYGWTNLTEAYDRWEESPYTRGSGASDVFQTAQSALALTATITGQTGINNGTMSMAAASWQPASMTGTATFTEVVSSGANQATYTFAGADIGTEDASRVVVLYVGVWNDGGSEITVTGVTIGGVAASRQAQYVGHSSGGSKFELWTLAVASGTSADIVVSTSSAGVVCQLCQVGIWDCKGISTTKTDSAGTHNTSTTSITVNLSCPANGVIIVGGYSTQSSIGFTNITEDYDSSTDPAANPEGSNYYSGASGAFETDQIDRAVGMTTSSEQLWMVAASFGPA